MPKKKNNYLYNIYRGTELIHEELSEQEFMDQMEFYAHEFYMTQDPALNPNNFRHEMKQLLEE